MNIYKPNSNDYLALYATLPDTQEELIHYLETKLRYDKKKLISDENKIKQIEWIRKEYVFYLIPKGTPRPRNCGNHFYVKGAKQAKRIFRDALNDEGIICTRCNFKLISYHPTPINSMTNNEIILAEKGLIRPISSPDFDNLAKTYTDALQGVLILNDNIINPGCVEKYYSIKPRIKIILDYQKTFDCNYNEQKTIKSVGYKKLLEGR